ncbi:MAG TPA: Rpp14/Pop5 family protein [Candidatus Nanoarchaeia archaeon]|nr:Rpp14/Pop5 family protein [Candidatus Nanoarchaeia archaeon]
MRPLLPSLREKKRYMRIEIISEKPVKNTEAFETIKARFLALVGTLSGVKANLRLVPEKSDKDIVVRIHRKFVDALRATLSLSTEVNKQKIIFRTARVSGSISKV